jgi:hypothetical protein
MDTNSKPVDRPDRGTVKVRQGAPSVSADEMPAWGNRDYEAELHAYYQAAPYWVT